MYQQDSICIPAWKQEKFLREVSRNWNDFYKRNTVNAYKDRHWLLIDFPQLANCSSILEVGCGVGNLLFPLLEKLPHLYIYACDFSPRAIDFVCRDERYDTSRCKAFVQDATRPFDTSIGTIPEESLDGMTLLFCLSAVPPEKHADVVENTSLCLKKGALVFVRDYGLYDAAQLNFKPGSKMWDRFYVRQDGTFAYYFDLDTLKSLFPEERYQCLSLEYVTRVVENRRTSKAFHRVFVQGTFRKL
ncbi:MAG: hypothetical protein SGCHY_003078 [Lobulomycetales sp.]